MNQHLGGWRPPETMQPERLWKLTPYTDLLEFSPWSHHNQLLNQNPDLPAIRTHADSNAIAASYRSGHIFIGKIDIPILNVRHYLEDELDMHHVAA